jgi:hypothetical protein
VPLVLLADGGLCASCLAQPALVAAFREGLERGARDAAALNAAEPAPP